MQPYNVKMLSAAREDVADIYYYIALDSPDAALSITDNIMDKIDALSEFPGRYPLVPDGELAKQGYRMLISDCYIAFFKILETDVLVHRIARKERLPAIVGINT